MVTRVSSLRLRVIYLCRLEPLKLLPVSTAWDGARAEATPGVAVTNAISNARAGRSPLSPEGSCYRRTPRDRTRGRPPMLRSPPSRKRCCTRSRPAAWRAFPVRSCTRVGDDDDTSKHGERTRHAEGGTDISGDEDRYIKKPACAKLGHKIELTAY